MCNACGFACCAWDCFSGCGCDCSEPACLRCGICDKVGHTTEECDEPEDERYYSDESADEDRYYDGLQPQALCYVGEGEDFDEWRETYVQPCALHRNAHCSRCHASL